MRVFFALLLVVFSLFSGPAQASFAATDTNPVGTCETAPCYNYSANVGSYGAIYGSSPLAACTASAADATSRNQWYTFTVTGVNTSNSQCLISTYKKSDGTFFNTQTPAYSTYSVAATAPVYSCPSGSTLAGSSCTCTPPNLQNATNDGCYNPQTTCVNGTPSDQVFSLGWSASGTTPMKRTPTSFCLDYTSPFVNPPPAPKCMTSFSGSAISPGGPTVNGAQEWFESGSMAQTATPCSAPVGLPTSTPAPPCVGQSGMVNGVAVCIAAESDAAKAQRAADAAALAARAAAAAAFAAGQTAAQQAAAATAAGLAAQMAILSGATSLQAAAAGVAAGLSAGAGGTSGAAAAHGAGAAAGSAAAAAAVAAGLSSAQQAAAAAAASAAATAAALGGGSAAAAAAAGSAAGSAAANGASADAAASAGAGAAGGRVAGSTGTGGGGDGVSQYCIDHPAAAMCKQSTDSTFTGACGAWVWTGDALVGSIAKEQHDRDCQFYNPDPDTQSTFALALSGADNQNMDYLKSHSQQVSVGLLDVTGSGWSRACPADPLIPLNFGRTTASFSIPFSRICGPLDILSLAGVGITLLGSMLWVLGSGKAV